MRIIWLLVVILLGSAIAQGTFKLVINGKPTSSGWISLNNKVYIPLEALQKAGVTVNKSGNTYTLTIPKATTVKPTAAAPKPPVNTAAPKPPATMTSPKPPVNTPVSVVTLPDAPVSPIAPVAPTNPPVTAPSPVTAPPNPIPAVNAASGTVKIVVSNASKPLLEGCSSQTLNNGVWTMRLLNFAPLIQNGKAGYLVTLEYSNITSQALSLFDSGFSDGEGGAGNFTLQLLGGVNLASNSTDPTFLYNSIQPNSKAAVDIFFFTNESSLPSPQRFSVGQERRVNGFTVSDPSLRFNLNCR